MLGLEPGQLVEHETGVGVQVCDLLFRVVGAGGGGHSAPSRRQGCGRAVGGDARAGLGRSRDRTAIVRLHQGIALFCFPQHLKIRNVSKQGLQDVGGMCAIGRCGPAERIVRLGQCFCRIEYREVTHFGLVSAHFRTLRLFVRKYSVVFLFLQLLPAAAVRIELPQPVVEIQVGW
ncbi:hypothetical protein [Nocardia niwae]|uniref:hypothetical protein n=1 Tax=Nocardia niwae TaxID=626084 RepID=UPI001471E2DD|nr:hypothetical protein [Nocardia niwae]